MSVLSAFATGLAQRLNTASIGVWKPTGVYTATDVAITIHDVPQAPDNIIAITVYSTVDDPELADSMIAVQFRSRAGPDPRTVTDRDDAIFDLFEQLREVDVNGVRLIVMWRQSSGALGQDENLRWEHAGNYYARVAWPTANRTD